jgi:hypothetical protein
VDSNSITAEEVAQKLAGQWVPWLYSDYVNPPYTVVGRVVGYYSFKTTASFVTTEHATMGGELVSGTKLTAPLGTMTGLGYCWVSVAMIAFSNVNLSQPEPRLARDFPHRCTLCQEPAFILATTVECSSWRCRHWYPKRGPGNRG